MIYKIIFQITEDSFLNPQYFEKRVIFNYKDSAEEDFTRKIINYSNLCSDTVLLLDAITALDPTAYMATVSNESGDIIITFINTTSITKQEADEESALNIGVINQFLKNI
jgi:formylmethanofuran dehydrogenase subunit E-like metal-binding protein